MLDFGRITRVEARARTRAKICKEKNEGFSESNRMKKKLHISLIRFSSSSKER